MRAKPGRARVPVEVAPPRLMSQAQHHEVKMPTIRDPDFPQYRRTASHTGIRKLLGLPDKAKLPVEGMPPREIQGLTVWVEPLGPNPTRHKRSTHRVLARCTCGKVLSVGRLHQHKCK